MDSTEITVFIADMTSEENALFVREELESLDGVESVEVRLNPEGVSVATVRASWPLDPVQIGEAVAEAGFTVVAPEA